jgi:hypothetical protein
LQPSFAQRASANTPSAGVVAFALTTAPPAAQTTLHSFNWRQNGVAAGQAAARSQATEIAKSVEERLLAVTQFESVRREKASSDHYFHQMRTNQGDPGVEMGVSFQGLMADGSRQRFQRLEGFSELPQPSPAPRPVLTTLNSFALERTGNRVQIVDEDGSVYEGDVVSADAEGYAEEPLSAGLREERGRQALPARRGLAEQSSGAPDLSQRLLLRARGTNRTLNQPVVVSATLSAPLEERLAKEARRNVASPVALAPSTAPTTRSALRVQSQASLLQLRLSGRATVGTNEFRLEAISDQPK